MTAGGFESGQGFFSPAQILFLRASLLSISSPRTGILSLPGMKTIDAVDFQPPDSLLAWSELPQHAGGPLYPARARPGIRSCAGHCGEALGSERALPAWRWLAVQRAYLWQLADFVAGYVADGEWSALESTIFALFADVGRMAVSAAHTPRLLRRARSLRGLSDGQLLLWCAASLPRLQSPPPPRLRRLCTHPPPPARHHPAHSPAHPPPH